VGHCERNGQTSASSYFASFINSKNYSQTTQQEDTNGLYSYQEYTVLTLYCSE